MKDLQGGVQVLELLVAIENAPITHDCRAPVVSTHEGQLTLESKGKGLPVSDIG